MTMQLRDGEVVIAREDDVDRAPCDGRGPPSLGGVNGDGGASRDTRATTYGIMEVCDGIDLLCYHRVTSGVKVIEELGVVADEEGRVVVEVELDVEGEAERMMMVVMKRVVTVRMMVEIMTVSDGGGGRGHDGGMGGEYGGGGEGHDGGYDGGMGGGYGRGDGCSGDGGGVNGDAGYGGGILGDDGGGRDGGGEFGDYFFVIPNSDVVVHES
ncbi:uncharacterized protein LOC130956680 [Arachis stenosperma]|uniref:uncharacterized protein LOC130956680 n=1 Tax=Arachis stenosperma TaxID=217475 RepID=UPI0025ABF4EF|nr:uncharacterized protein LOC130956680 [Arachis stenosperma]